VRASGDKTKTQGEPWAKFSWPFGPQNEYIRPAGHVFRDETAIGYGDDIRDTILEELEKADVLVALLPAGNRLAP
jgi:hypothetical protein